MISPDISFLSSEAFEEQYFLLNESEVLGRSNLYTLFRAFDARLEQTVFVKVMAPSPLIQPIHLPALAALQHPHLVALLNVFYLSPPPGSDYAQPLLVLVMNYVEGRPLSGFSLPLPLPQADRIHQQLRAAISYLHAQNWVHRDIKADNVLIAQIDDDWQATLCDLEMAAPVGVIPELLVGTPEYMSAATARMEALHPAQDYWSLGCLLYQLLTGELPFGIRDFSMDAADAVTDLQNHIRQSDISELVSRIPAEFQPFLTQYWSLHV